MILLSIDHRVCVCVCYIVYRPVTVVIIYRVSVLSEYKCVTLRSRQTRFKIVYVLGDYNY